MREGLLAYYELMKQDAREKYNREVQLFAQGALTERPRWPSILSDA